MPGYGAGLESGQQGGIAAEVQREGLGHGLAGEVVLGGAKTAHDRHNVSAAQGKADGVDEVLPAVADDGLEGHGDADFIELFGEIKRVGILAKRGEHFRTDSDDLGFHKGSSWLSALSF